MSSVSVTKATYPTIFEMFETISHDGGGQAGWLVYLVPQEWGDRLKAIEESLLPLCADDLQTFSIGEMDDSFALCDTHGLDDAVALIEAFLFFNFERSR